MTSSLERWFLDRDGVRLPFVGTAEEAMERARMLAHALRAGVTVLRPGGGEVAHVDPCEEA